MIYDEKENLIHGKGLAAEERSSPEMRRVMYSGGIELFTGSAFSERFTLFYSLLLYPSFSVLKVLFIHIHNSDLDWYK